MKMTRKLLPLSLYDGPGMESWLESRANEGLFPVKLGYFQAVFSPIGVPGTRFRLVVKAGKEEEMPRRSGSSLKKPAGGISALSPACTISFAPPTPTPRKSIPTGKPGNLFEANPKADHLLPVQEVGRLCNPGGAAGLGDVLLQQRI